MVTGGSNSVVVEKDAVEGASAAPQKEADHENSPDFIPAPWSWITLLGLIFVPLTIYWIRERRQKTDVNTT